MGQIANQMVLEAFFKLKQKIDEKRKEKKRIREEQTNGKK